jgi:predicted CopG family antitoxin
MHTIEVDFEVYKQLTIRRATEDVSYNDVIRELLELGQAEPRAGGKAGAPSSEDWIAKGVSFPVATEFRANYKGRTITARVEGGALMLNGQRYDSPSAAAVSVTGSPVNGWRFWECKLPGKSSWQLIEGLRR